MKPVITDLAAFPCLYPGVQEDRGSVRCVARPEEVRRQAGEVCSVLAEVVELAVSEQVRYYISYKTRWEDRAR